MAAPSQKLAEQVAARIEADIAARGWPVGEVIGSEADLLEKYGVSRAVLREAIRLVEHHLVGRMRPGPGGGLVVTEQDPNVVARSMSAYLSFAKVGREELLEIRSQIEGYAAEMAAARASDSERVRLREFLTSEVERVSADWREAKEFHLRVAQLAHNPATLLFVRCLVDLTEEKTMPEQDRETVVARLHAAHEKIAEAIVAGDGGIARYRMTRHIYSISPWLKPQVQEPVRAA